MKKLIQPENVKLIQKFDNGNEFCYTFGYQGRIFLFSVYLSYFKNSYRVDFHNNMSLDSNLYFKIWQLYNSAYILEEIRYNKDSEIKERIFNFLNYMKEYAVFL